MIDAKFSVCCVIHQFDSKFVPALPSNYLCLNSLQLREVRPRYVLHECESLPIPILVNFPFLMSRYSQCERKKTMYQNWVNKISDEKFFSTGAKKHMYCGRSCIRTESSQIRKIINSLMWKHLRRL